MISNILQDALSKQIVEEIFSADLYLSMFFYLEKRSFDGFPGWMERQLEEEMDHTYQMTSYITKCGGEAAVNQISAVKQTWTSPLNAFEDACKHEYHISHLIDELLDKAVEENDKAAQDFLWQFIHEQIEEEATANSIVDRIKRMDDAAVFNLDQQYGSRMKQPLDT